jgi:hypothetical protein
VVLVRNDHRAVWDLGEPPKVKQGEHTPPRMRPNAAPLLFFQLTGLVQDLDGYLTLSHIVEQRRDAEIVELVSGETESLADRDTQDADVHRVRKRVLVIIAKGREADQRYFILQHLVDDALHGALHLLGACGPPKPDTVDHILGDGD